MFFCRKDLPNYIFALSIILMGLLSQLINIDGIMLFTYSVFMAWIVIKKRTIFLKYFYFIFITSWMLLSVYLIDNSHMFIPNLQIYSSHTGALAPLLVINSICWSVLIKVDKYLEVRCKVFQKNILAKKKSRIYMYLEILLTCTIIVFIADIFQNNYFISGAANRFFYQMENTSISLKYYGYLVFFIPIFSIRANKIGNKRCFSAYCLLYAIFLLLTGVKFGGLFQMIYFIAITYILSFQTDLINRHYRKILLYAVGLFLVFFAYSFGQMYYECGSLETIIGMLVNRISNGQGDVWWGIHYKFRGITHMDELRDELSVFSVSGISQAEYNFGIYKLMRLIAPPFVVNAYAAQRARFACSTEASLYYLFGFWGCLLVKILMTVMISMLVNKLIQACESNDGLEAVLYVWLISHYTRIFSMSDFYLLVSKSTVICIVILMVRHFIKRKNFKGKVKILT